MHELVCQCELKTKLLPTMDVLTLCELLTSHSLPLGMPMYFMEVSLGQFSQLGPLSVWKLAPIGRGVGFAMCTLSLIVSIYHNVIMGYCLHYIYHSFASVLPWDTCSQPWSDERFVQYCVTNVKVKIALTFCFA